MTAPMDDITDIGGEREPGLARLIESLTPTQEVDIRSHIRGLQDGADTYATPPHGWTCFHCGENFRTFKGARLHFGTSVQDRPTCQAGGTP